MAARKLPTDLLDNGAAGGAVAATLGHRDPTVVPKFYGRHIEQRREHLRGLIEADDQRGLTEKTDQPPQPPEPAKSEQQGNLIRYATREEAVKAGKRLYAECSP